MTLQPEMSCSPPEREVSVIMKRTIVFTLPRGLKAVPKDFEPVLDIVIGKMLAFVTVGVGHTPR